MIGTKKRRRRKSSYGFESSLWKCLIFLQYFYVLFGVRRLLRVDVGQRRGRLVDVFVDTAEFIIRLLLTEVLLSLRTTTNQTDQKLCQKPET